MNEDDDEPPPNRNTFSAVLKFGGEVVADRDALLGVLKEVAELVDRGWRFVIVHGGGPQTGAQQAREGLTPRKVAGRRVTDAPTLEVAKQVLAGSVNVDVVAAGVLAELRCVGVCGASILQASRRPPETIDGVAVDYGYVGEVQAVDTAVFEALWSRGRTPVVAPLGMGHHGAARGQVFNINADTVAAAVAAAIEADHLFLMTTAGGVLRDVRDPSSTIATLTAAQARAAIDDGTIVGGMIPKVADALELLDQGIGVVHILGPRSLRAAAQTPGAVGTALVAEGAA